ncbi:MAG TPA: hypothetical protein VLX68_04725 [Chitinivibrionales bacterium]|nr:hypothetical protein [Chitinivibrionales bacterium]
MNISVETFSGYKADEYPVRFSLQDRRYEIISIEDRWYSPGCSYFRVFADDGNTYILKQIPGNNEWQIVSAEG